MLTTTLVIGLLGALLMFCGDMTLYFDKNDFEQNGTLQPIIDIMKGLPKIRVMIGGWIGPIAAFLYCIGFYHIVLIVDEASRTLAFVAFLLACMGIIAGGAYHSHCAYMGLLGLEEQKEDLEIVMSYFQKLPFILYAGEGLGLLILLFLVVTEKTILPVWMAVLTPGILFLLKPLARRLPKELHMVICGGFSNIIFMILFYAVMLAALLLIIGLWNGVRDFKPAYLQALLFLEVMNLYDGIIIDRLWVGHSKFWIIPGTEDLPFVRTWPQVLKKRCILALIWIAGAAIAAGLVVLLF